jgi:hypothetical protein
MAASETFHIHVNENSRQTQVSEIAVCLGILAFSVQFSPSYGYNWPWLLVLSWICLLLAALGGGWRLNQRSIMLQLNAQKIGFDQAVAETRKSLASIQHLGDDAIFPTVSFEGKPATKQMLREFLKHNERESRKCDELMKAFNDTADVWFYSQVTLFILGLVANGTFTAYNYLLKAQAIGH